MPGLELQHRPVRAGGVAQRRPALAPLRSAAVLGGAAQVEHGTVFGSEGFQPAAVGGIEGARAGHAKREAGLAGGEPQFAHAPGCGQRRDQRGQRRNQRAGRRREHGAGGHRLHHARGAAAKAERDAARPGVPGDGKPGTRPVSEGLARDRWQPLAGLQPRDAFECTGELLLVRGELRGARQVLQRAAAAVPEVRAVGRAALGRGAQHLEQPRLVEARLGMGHAAAHLLAGKCAGDEHGLAVAPRHAAAVVAEARDLERDLARRSRPDRCWWFHACSTPDPVRMVARSAARAHAIAQ